MTSKLNELRNRCKLDVSNQNSGGEFELAMTIGEAARDWCWPGDSRRVGSRQATHARHERELGLAKRSGAPGFEELGDQVSDQGAELR